MKKPKVDYAIQTVTNALRLLHEFRDEEELGVTELSRRLGLHKNNVFRLLATLELEGYIEQSHEVGRRYRLGPRSLELAQAFARSRSLMRRARPFLVELAAVTRECAHLGMLQDFEVAHLDAEATEDLIAAGKRIGRRLPAHCTALGKILLGCASDDVRGAYVRTVLGDRPLERRTDATIVDRQKLLEHIRTGAAQGYAVDVEECAPGLCCLAAPVLDERGEIVAAFSVSGPSVRTGPDRLHGEIRPAVVEAAERLSSELGWSPTELSATAGRSARAAAR